MKTYNIIFRSTYQVRGMQGIHEIIKSQMRFKKNQNQKF